jgi:hypothetical protein
MAVSESTFSRLIDRVREEPHCAVDATPVPFGRRGWLAQHRWLEPAVGISLLLPVGVLYLLSASTVGRSIDVVLAVVWLGFVGVGWSLRRLRPCAVLRFPAYALVAWLAIMAVALH